MSLAEGKRRTHEAVQAFLDEGELAVSWVLTIDVAGADGSRYLAHRSGGGLDGQEESTQWAALGMLRASAAVAECQLLDSTTEPDDDDEPDEPDE